MIIENINDLKIKLSEEDTKSICIIDNNFISFLLELKKELDISYILSSYDLILIPKWVEVEINDSEYYLGEYGKLYDDSKDMVM